MKLSTASLTKLAEMICGDQPFSYFPYRSSSQLTRFFIELDLDYVHDGSTRRLWVTEVLKDLNSKEARNEKEMPPHNLRKVIEYLLHPDHFLFNEDLNREQAKEAVIKVLTTNNLTLAEQPNGLVKVCPLHGEFVSTSYDVVPAEKLITFRPSVFQVPDKPQNDRLVSVMMPFNPGFNKTYDAIRKVTEHMGLQCNRADDIWDNETIMQDIFDLIYCAKAVIVDFSGRNPNVMYETGIAHTLGKTVIPITQSIEDIPSDIGHHRALKYLPNDQGYKDLSNVLYKRLKVVFNQSN